MAPGKQGCHRGQRQAVADAAGGPGIIDEAFQPGCDCKLIPASIALA